MRLTQKLLGYLNRIFDKEPKSFLALRLSYDGDLTWEVADRVLTLNARHGTGGSLSVDLTQYTIGSLVDFLAAQTGYSIQYIDHDRENLAAWVLLDGSGDPSQSNGDHFYGYTSLLWALLDGVSVELTALKAAIDQAPGQISIPTSSGYWLDELGSYYDVPRHVGERDERYGVRILAVVMRPHGNNVAIEQALKYFTGADATVTDVVVSPISAALYNSAFLFDGSHTYSGTVQQDEYGLFDVTYPYDLEKSDEELAAFQLTVAAIIERLRDAGTHLRSQVITGPHMGDTAKAPTDSMVADVEVAIADNGITPTDDFTIIGQGDLGLADDVDLPTDDSDGLIIVAYFNHYGTYAYNGEISYYGDCIVEEDMSGGTIISVTPFTEDDSLETEDGEPITDEDGRDLIVTA